MHPQLLNGSNLAYIGDAYYELRVRYHLLSKGITKSAALRKASIAYVSATAHQKIYTSIQAELNEEEKQIFLRGRNHAPKGHRKNVDKAAYVISSGLEAIIGYLYLTGNQVRLDDLIQKMFDVVEGV
ncbi:MAG: hypothetical protein NC182_04705 [Prevotella sp.]|nr:ribonuclease III [Staphylococcus sp.]MCM1350484.1 hypothetical protein [Prevotella sp.]